MSNTDSKTKGQYGILLVEGTSSNVKEHFKFTQLLSYHQTHSRCVWESKYHYHNQSTPRCQNTVRLGKLHVVIKIKPEMPKVLNMGILWVTINMK